jgi:hypothetical protein
VLKSTPVAKIVLPDFDVLRFFKGFLSWSLWFVVVSDLWFLVSRRRGLTAYSLQFKALNNITPDKPIKTNRAFAAKENIREKSIQLHTKADNQKKYSGENRRLYKLFFPRKKLQKTFPK